MDATLTTNTLTTAIIATAITTANSTAGVLIIAPGTTVVALRLCDYSSLFGGIFAVGIERPSFLSGVYASKVINAKVSKHFNLLYFT